MSTLIAPAPPDAPAIEALVRDSDAPPYRSEQEEFDAAVKRNTTSALHVLGGLAIVAALVMSVVALVVSTAARPGSAPRVQAVTPSPAAPIDLSVAGSNKLGPDGKMHDSLSKTDFAVKVGQPTILRINNTDSGPHSITAAATGVSITVRPGLHSYAVLATKAGRFEWVCVIPCDSAAKGWAMTHPGYMAGYITATQS